MRNNGIGLPENLVTLTRKMYEGMACKVIHEGHLSDSFEVKTGVRKSYLLSPFLFILAVYWLNEKDNFRKKNWSVMYSSVPWAWGVCR